MKDRRSPVPTSEFKTRLRTLMLIRVLLVSLLLGAGLFIDISETEAYFGPLQSIHFSLLASIYFLTIIYLFLFKIGRALLVLAYVQLGFDALFTALIMSVTGGMHSVFSLLFVLVIITASILLYRSGGVIIATACTILYSLVVALHYWRILGPLGPSYSPPNPPSGINVLYLTCVNVLAFYVVAFLTSYLSELVQRSKTELEAKQEDFHQLESLTEGIIKSINSGVIALDHRGKIMLFNPAAEGIFKISYKEVIGKRLDETLSWFAKSANLEGKTVVGNFGCYSKFRDLSFVDEKQTTVHLRYSVSPLRLSPKGVFGQIIVVQDITEIKKVEQEMAKVQSLALVGELAAGIAHEIRNPMASISGSIQMLREELSHSEMHARLMDIVLKEVSRLNELVSDFLLFARPRKPSPQIFDLHQLIRETLQLFEHTPHWDSKIGVHCHLNNEMKIKSDPQLTKQILWNLLKNACEAMPSGGDLYIATSISCNGDGRTMVTLEIRDTGAGFAEESVSEIFTPFFTTKEDGSGLGLAIVKRIVEVLGGQITGENHPDGGACFKVKIPSEP